MSDTFIRHLISFIGVLICGAVYLAGYLSGAQGWWWTAIGLVVIYIIVYKLVEA